MIVRDLHGLYPPVRKKAIEFIAYANSHIHDYIIEPFETLRSYDRQVAVHSTGQSQSSISYHMFGLAIDVWPSNDSGTWPTSTQLNAWKHWQQLGEMGEAFGFSWGGRFQSLVDRPHFEMTFGSDRIIMAKLLNTSGMPAVWKYVDAKARA